LILSHARKKLAIRKSCSNIGFYIFWQVLADSDISIFFPFTMAPKEKRVIGKGGAAMKVLNAAAKWKVERNKDLPRRKVPFLTGINGSSTIRNAFAALKDELLIEVTKESVVVTDRGMELADLDAVDLSSAPSTNTEYLESRKVKLTARECAVVDTIADGLVHTKNEIAERLNMKRNSTFRNLMAALKKKDIVEYKDNDSIQLHEDMTPFDE
jgi:DNA-binding CsgD family transcriptional regulator